MKEEDLVNLPTPLTLAKAQLIGFIQRLRVELCNEINLLNYLLSSKSGVNTVSCIFESNEKTHEKWKSERLMEVFFGGIMAVSDDEENRESYDKRLRNTPSPTSMQKSHRREKSSVMGTVGHLAKLNTRQLYDQNDLIAGDDALVLRGATDLCDVLRSSAFIAGYQSVRLKPSEETLPGLSPPVPPPIDLPSSRAQSLDYQDVEQISGTLSLDSGLDLSPVDACLLQAFAVLRESELFGLLVKLANMKLIDKVTCSDDQQTEKVRFIDFSDANLSTRALAMAFYLHASSVHENLCGNIRMRNRDMMRGDNMLAYLCKEYKLPQVKAIRILERMLTERIIQLDRDAPTATSSCVKAKHRHSNLFFNDSKHFYRLKIDCPELVSSISTHQFLSDDYPLHNYLFASEKPFETEYEDWLDDRGRVTWPALLHTKAPYRLLSKTIKRDKFGGFGMTIRGASPCYVCTTELEGTAERNGIREGQFVVEVDSKLVLDSTYPEVEKLLRSPRDWVHIIILEKHEKQIHQDHRCKKEDTNADLCSLRNNENNNELRAWFHSEFGAFPEWMNLETGRRTRLLNHIELAATLTSQYKITSVKNTLLTTSRDVYKLELYSFHLPLTKVQRF